MNIFGFGLPARLEHTVTFSYFCFRPRHDNYPPPNPRTYVSDYLQAFRKKPIAYRLLPAVF
jgi:hypothetical protein